MDFIPSRLAGAERATSLQIFYLIDNQSNLTKMALFDLSAKTEELIFKELTNWKAVTLKDILMKNYVLARAACGAGYMELWEWEKIESTLNPGSLASVNISALNEFMNVARGTLEWSTGMIRAVYGKDIKLFEGFEPLAMGFPDDLIRSSVLLHLGQSVGELGRTRNLFSSTI